MLVDCVSVLGVNGVVVRVVIRVGVFMGRGGYGEM